MSEDAKVPWPAAVGWQLPDFDLLTTFDFAQLVTTVNALLTVNRHLGHAGPAARVVLEELRAEFQTTAYRLLCALGLGTEVAEEILMDDGRTLADLLSVPAPQKTR